MVKKTPHATVPLIYVFISTVFSKCLIQFSMFFAQKFCICRISDFAVSEDVGIETPLGLWQHLNIDCLSNHYVNVYPIQKGLGLLTGKI
jgi:hypothetical protein